MRWNLVCLAAVGGVLLFAGCGSDPAGVVPPAITRILMGHPTTTVCGLINDGSVWCSEGSEVDGETSAWGGTEAPSVPVKQLVSGVAKFKIGGGWKCATNTVGDLFCWGINFSGQLGDGTATNRFLDKGNAILTGVSDFSVGYTSTCAIVTGGAVKCFGNNGLGQLGTGDNTASNVPVSVVSLGGAATALAAAGNSHCAIVGTGVRCWGEGASGELGNGDTLSSSSPVTVTGLSGTPKTIGGGYQQYCVLIEGGAVQCWGRGSNGEMGNGVDGDISSAGTALTLGEAATAVATGSYHTCALLASGAVKCWGYNAQGQVGDGSTSSRNTPTAVTAFGTDKVSAIAAGSVSTCVLLQDATTVKCWGGGANADGTDSPTAVLRSPILATAATPAKLSMFALEAAFATSCFPMSVAAVTSTGGLATPVTAAVPVNVAIVSGAGAFYSDAACTTTTTSTTIAIGKQSSTIFYKTAAAEGLEATATAPGAELTPSGSTFTDVTGGI